MPVDKLDPVYFESSYHLAPSKGAEKPYRLLAETLEKTSRLAIAQTVLHEKETPVIVRSVRNGATALSIFEPCFSFASQKPWLVSKTPRLAHAGASPARHTVEIADC